MGKENNENNIQENKDEIDRKNNPFASENSINTEQEKEESSSKDDIEENECKDAISELKEEIDKINNQYIRLAADFDNYRKRQMQEREALLKYGAEETLKKMIEALDNIDRAKKSVENIDDVNTVKESYDIVFKQIFDILNKMGLETIDTVGKEFDPNLHEAVMQTPTTEQPENTIIAELQKGYKLGDKVLRPSLVNVAVSE